MTPPLDTSMPPGGVDPRVERSRAAVVEAAAELLLADGPDAITHGRVAAAAHVSRTTVYKHYPDRSDLLFATVQAIGKHMPEADAITGDLRIDLRTFVDVFATDLRDDGRSRLIAMMMERAMHDAAVALVRDTFMSEISVVFAQLISAGIESGELRADIDADRSLAALSGSLIFQRFLAARNIDAALIDHVVDDFLAINAPR